MKRVLYALAVICSAAPAAVAQHNPTPPSPSGQASAHAELFRRAVDFEGFLAADTAEVQVWRANYANAAAAVDAVRPRVSALRGKWYLLVVAENWCSDSYGSVPYLARLAAESPNLELRLLRKADAQGILASHRLGEREAIPLVVLLDENFVERGAWVEHPRELHAMIGEQKDRVCEDQLSYLVRRWYRENAGRAAIADVLELLAAAAV